MKRKILVVDDEAALTRMIKLNLERTEKYDVRTENLGKRAVAAAKEFQPDLIFLDILMPDMAGDEIAQELRQIEELSKIKLVFMTAMVSKQDTSSMGTNIGGNEFLAKPVTIEDMLETIERILGS
jgi:CheY-like chemotaxis protein